MRFDVLLMASVTILAAACSSGATAESYFADLERISTNLDAELDELEATFNAGLLELNFEQSDAEEELVDLFQESIGGIAASFGRLVDELSQLTPPSQLEDPHEDAVDAGLQVLDDYRADAAQLEAIVTLSDIGAYAEELSISEARNRFVKSCRVLQEIADRDEIGVRLNC